MPSPNVYIMSTNVRESRGLVEETRGLEEGSDILGIVGSA